jgi:hypothetical protein
VNNTIREKNNVQKIGEREKGRIYYCGQPKYRREGREVLLAMICTYYNDVYIWFHVMRYANVI